jgi:hypothetical protein
VRTMTWTRPSDRPGFVDGCACFEPPEEATSYSLGREERMFCLYLSTHVLRVIDWFRGHQVPGTPYVIIKGWSGFRGQVPRFRGHHT